MLDVRGLRVKTIAMRASRLICSIVSHVCALQSRVMSSIYPHLSFTISAIQYNRKRILCNVEIHEYIR